MKNWKTTLAGLVGAILNLWVGGVSIKTAIVSGTIVTVAALAKDSNVTGGTVQQ